MAGVHISPLHIGDNSTGASGVTVTVNNGSSVGQSQSVTPQMSLPRRGVTITPIRSLQPKPVIIAKALLKAESKKGTGKKKSTSSKTFVLRGINVATVTTCSHLKALIRKQVGGEIVEDDFDVGYLQGSNAIVMRNEEDIHELFSSLLKGSNTIIWCDGLVTHQTSTVRKRPLDSDSDDEERPTKKTKKEEKDSAVKKCIEDLKSAHKEKYTPMQYRIWAEMKMGGLHDNMTTPPATSMFVRAGGTTPKRATSASDPMSQAISQLASALTPSASSTNVSSRVGDSPAKVIDNRSKCYRQLAELKNLVESRLLSEEEYTSERQAVMDVLHKLKEK